MNKRLITIGILVTITTIVFCSEALGRNEISSAMIEMDTVASPEVTEAEEPVEAVETEVDTESEAVAEGTEESDEADYEAAMKKRFGDSWGMRIDSVSIGNSQVIAHDKAVADIVTIGGTTELYGYAADVVTIRGNTRIGKDGVVQGDLVTILGNIMVEKGGTVRGDAVSILGNIIDPNTGIKGNTVHISGPLGWGLDLLGLAGGSWVVFLLWMKVFGVIVALLLAYLIIAIMPKATVRIGSQVTRTPFISGVVGIGTIMASPMIFVLLLITLIGILLVPLALLVALWLGMVAIYYMIGSKVRAAFRKNSYKPFLDVTIGVLIVALISLVPVFGWIAKFALAVAGLGALILTRFGTREGIKTTLKTAPAPSESASL